jgi:CarD family transcriptional regulator
MLTLSQFANKIKALSNLRSLNGWQAVNVKLPDKWVHNYRKLRYILTVADKKYPFKLKQKVVYPTQGVGVINSIEEKDFNGEKVPYFIVYLEVTDMTIMVPVSKVEELGIRAIVPAEDAQKALEFVGETFEPNPSDWKLRYQMNLELLKHGTVMDIATIVRSLYHRSKVKELPIKERKLYESAKKLFEDELACALKKNKDEIETMIHTRLENR